MRLALGDLAGELFLGGQRIIPAKALLSGFVFRTPGLHAALAAILGAPARDDASRAEGRSALRHAGM